MLSKRFKILPPEGFLWPDSPPAELQAHLHCPHSTQRHRPPLCVRGYSEILKFSKVNAKIHLSSGKFSTDFDLTAGEIYKIFLCTGSFMLLKL